MAEQQPTGTIAATPDGVQVQLVREFATPPAELWTLLTHPEELFTWLGTTTLTPAVGGPITISFDDGALVVEGCVQQYDPPHCLAYTWHEGATLASVVRFDLQPTADGQGTVLTLTHRQLTGAEVRNFAAGWEHHLELLAARVAGRPADWDWLRFNDLLAGYDEPAEQ